MSATLKPALWVASLSALLVILIISGAQAGQSRTVTDSKIISATNTSTSTPTSTPTITITSTLTSTPTPTLTSTPSSSPTLTPTPTPTPTSTPLEIVIEEPDIHPAYNGLCNSYWYLYTDDRGQNAYLTLNVNDPIYSTNWAEWRPTILKPGYYRVEAYIPFHPPIVWECTPNPVRNISHDTSDARYTILHADGQTLITGTQSSFSNEWLPLGEYLFRAGSDGFVSLSDLNGEANLTTTVSFSAVRFTWQRPPPISNYLPLISKLTSSVITSTVGIPALDQCHLPTAPQMQTWWDNSPYQITNVYIGGGLLYHDCSVPDRNWIETVRNQGWGMIPTWVGPQAPCSGYRLRMSADPQVAFLQGQAEADAASLVASEIGLAGSSTGGTIIYYDVENYNPADNNCRNTVKSFIAGWTDRLHYLGNRSGSYGGACTSYVSDWAGAAFPPDNVWVAAWDKHYKKYTPNVPLFGITCLPDYLWPNHQRIRQYASGHNETYGGVTFDIDSNIADAEVVTPSRAIAGLSSTTYISSSTPEISNFGSFQNSPNQGWLIVDGNLYRNSTDRQRWQLVPAPITNFAMSSAYFLDENRGWLIGAANDISFQLYSTLDGGETWHDVVTPPIEPGWYPYSLQFFDMQQGWIVVKQMTGSNFSIGRLYRTSNGGANWQLLDLPLGEAVSFITPDVGWVVGGVDGKDIYHTHNGGQTWNPVTLPLPADEYFTLALPAFSDLQKGILPVIVHTTNETQLEIYATHDGGETWILNGKFTHLPEGFASVKFTSPQVGLSVTTVGTCGNSGDAKACSLQSELWRTVDGGETWSVVEFP